MIEQPKYSERKNETLIQSHTYTHTDRNVLSWLNYNLCSFFRVNNARRKMKKRKPNLTISFKNFDDFYLAYCSIILATHDDCFRFYYCFVVCARVRARSQWFYCLLTIALLVRFFWASEANARLRAHCVCCEKSNDRGVHWN